MAVVFDKTKSQFHLLLTQLNDDLKKRDKEYELSSTYIPVYDLNDPAFDYEAYEESGAYTYSIDDAYIRDVSGDHPYSSVIPTPYGFDEQEEKKEEIFRNKNKFYSSIEFKPNTKIVVKIKDPNAEYSGWGEPPPVASHIFEYQRLWYRVTGLFDTLPEINQTKMYDEEIALLPDVFEFLFCDVSSLEFSEFGEAFKTPRNTDVGIGNAAERKLREWFYNKVPEYKLNSICNPDIGNNTNPIGATTNSLVVDLKKLPISKNYILQAFKVDELLYGGTVFLPIKVKTDDVGYVRYDKKVKDWRDNWDYSRYEGNDNLKPINGTGPMFESVDENGHEYRLSDLSLPKSMTQVPDGFMNHVVFPELGNLDSNIFLGGLTSVPEDWLLGHRYGYLIFPPSLVDVPMTSGSLGMPSRIYVRDENEKTRVTELLRDHPEFSVEYADPETLEGFIQVDNEKIYF